MKIAFWKKRRKNPIFWDLVDGNYGVWLYQENNGDGTKNNYWKEPGWIKKEKTIYQDPEGSIFTIPDEMIHNKDIQRRGIKVRIVGREGKSPIISALNTELVKENVRLKVIMHKMDLKMKGLEKAAQKAGISAKRTLAEGVDIVSEARKLEKRERDFPEPERQEEEL